LASGVRGRWAFWPQKERESEGDGDGERVRERMQPIGNTHTRREFG